MATAQVSQDNKKSVSGVPSLAVTVKKIVQRKTANATNVKT